MPDYSEKIVKRFLLLSLLITACATGADPEADRGAAPESESLTEPAVGMPMRGDSTPAPEPTQEPTPVATPAATPRPPRITYNGVDITSKHVALTFDDGPHKTLTPQLLDILAKRNVRATFYVVGQNVAAYPEIAARIVREGHEIANHSWSHPSFTKISQTAARSQLSRTEDAIVAATGVRPTNFRPPYGAYTQSIAGWIHRDFGYENILWTVDPRDWQKPGVSVVTQRMVSGAAPGAIILAHDIHESTIRAVPSAVDQLLAQGYEFVTVSELIAMERSQPTAPVRAAGAIR